MQSIIVFEQAAPNHAISVAHLSVASRSELPAMRLWVKCRRRVHSISRVRASTASRYLERALRLRLGVRLWSLGGQGSKLILPKMMDRTFAGMIAICRRSILVQTSGAGASGSGLVAASDEG